DFAGPGRGKVSFEVVDGDSSAQICRNLTESGVVASVPACIDAAAADPESPGIQVGFYPLKKEMAADDA
ncbi:aminodeoxychorismate lyase, partial [Nocardioides sp. SOB77]|nr:aminodeoxychorismate lyase [Nocardioides oceani]